MLNIMASWQFYGFDRIDLRFRTFRSVSLQAYYTNQNHLGMHSAHLYYATLIENNCHHSVGTYTCQLFRSTAFLYTAQYCHSPSAPQLEELTHCLALEDSRCYVPIYIEDGSLGWACTNPRKQKRARELGFPKEDWHLRPIRVAPLDQAATVTTRYYAGIADSDFTLHLSNSVYAKNLCVLTISCPVLLISNTAVGLCPNRAQFANLR